ncbi:MAG: PfkB family carbohydrate kinase [Synechococcales bacterium]|nr:PfkB family carbohydrate kinase [Synechococcales bacterium]
MSNQPDGKTCLVVGAINVDVLGRVDRFCNRDEAVEVKNLTIAPGGHASNCAIAMSRLGKGVNLCVRLSGCVGADEFSRIALQALQTSGIDTAHITRTGEAQTGQVFIPVLPNGDKALYVARGANEYLSAEALAAAIADCEVIVVFDPPLRLIPTLANGVASKTVIFAPGGLVSSVSKHILFPLLKASDILVVNRPESASMTGISEPKSAAAKLATEWNLSAIVTVGAEGCWVAQPGQPVEHCPSFAVEVVDSTGAGDAFVAGLTVALSLGKPLLLSAQIGCAVGALATQSLGAQAAPPSFSEVKDLIAQAQLMTAPPVGVHASRK